MRRAARGELEELRWLRAGLRKIRLLVMAPQSSMYRIPERIERVLELVEETASELLDETEEGDVICQSC